LALVFKIKIDSLCWSVASLLLLKDKATFQPTFNLKSHQSKFNWPFDYCVSLWLPKN